LAVIAFSIGDQKMIAAMTPQKIVPIAIPPQSWLLVDIDSPYVME
jgi:hypothetical protein